MKCLYIPLLLILILSGCSAEWHLSKAVTKDPSILSTKTMTVMDTVVIEPIAVRDTVIISQVDTVEIIKDKFRVKIMRSYDTLIIDGGCDSDTIVRTVRVEVPVVEYKERNGILDSMYRGSFYVLLFGILVFIVKDLINKRF